MLQRISIFVQLERKSFVRFAVSVLFALFLGCSSAPMFAQQPGQRTFASPEDAGPAFFAAMQAKDRTIYLGHPRTGRKEVLSSGDAAEDSDARVGFVVQIPGDAPVCQRTKRNRNPGYRSRKLAVSDSFGRNQNGSWYFDNRRRQSRDPIPSHRQK